MSTFTFGAPPPSSRLGLSDFNGCTLIVAVGGCHPSWQTQYRTQPAVRGGFIALNGDHAGEEFHDFMFFNQRVVRQLRGIPNTAIVALVNVDRASQDAVELLEATAEMTTYANEWVAANPGKVEALIKSSVEAFAIAEQTQQGAAPRPAFQAPRQVAPPPPPPLGPNYGRASTDEPPF